MSDSNSCESMARQLNGSCDEHSSPSECPDVLIGRSKDNLGGAFRLFPGPCEIGSFARSRHGRLHGVPGNK
jgi:hypothetical protein